MKQQRPAKFRSVSLSFLPVFVGAMLAGSVASEAAVLASWDTWGDSATYAADNTTTGFTATATIPTGNRANSSFGSTDGDFGNNLSGAETALTGLLVRPNNGDNVVTITLNNSTGVSYNINSIHFDYGRRLSAPDGFSLVYTSGGLGADVTTIGSASGLAQNVSNSQAAGEGDTYYQYDFGLATPLSDITLGTGESAVFTLTFAGDGGGAASGVLDNLAIQGAVPEPSSAALIGLVGLALFFRRRR